MHELELGDVARVAAVEGQGALRIRLLEMGLTPGVQVRLLKQAPSGDPLQFQVRGYHLSLRRAEASRVRVKSESR